MPGPKKPRHLKAIAGTDRPDRAPDDEPVGEVVEDAPDAPDWLPNAHATKEWNRLAPLLVANQLLTTESLATFGHLCALHGKIVQLWAAGETPTGHLLAQYAKLIEHFGITPMAAGRLKRGTEKPKANKFERFKGGKAKAPSKKARS